MTLGKAAFSWRAVSRKWFCRELSVSNSQQLGNRSLCPKEGVLVALDSICYNRFIVLLRSGSFICSVLWTASLEFWLVSFGGGRGKLPKEDSWDELRPHHPSRPLGHPLRLILDSLATHKCGELTGWQVWAAIIMPFLGLSCCIYSSTYKTGQEMPLWITWITNTFFPASTI